MEIILRRTAFSAGRTPLVFSVRSVSNTVDPQTSNLASKTDSELSEQSQSKSETSIKSATGIKSMSGFGKAFEKFSMLTNKSSQPEPDTKFATLLRHSKLMQVNHSLQSGFQIHIHLLINKHPMQNLNMH